MDMNFHRNHDHASISQQMHHHQQILLCYEGVLTQDISTHLAVDQTFHLVKILIRLNLLHKYIKQHNRPNTIIKEKMNS